MDGVEEFLDDVRVLCLVGPLGELVTAEDKVVSALPVDVETPSAVVVVVFSVVVLVAVAAVVVDG